MSRSNRLTTGFDVMSSLQLLLAATAVGSHLFRLPTEAYTPRLREHKSVQEESEVKHLMNWKSKLILGVLTALAMMVLTYALPRGGSLRDAALVQFPVTVGVWAIFVLLFVKLK
jgi:hypothetical protein